MLQHAIEKRRNGRQDYFQTLPSGSRVDKPLTQIIKNKSILNNPEIVDIYVLY